MPIATSIARSTDTPEEGIEESAAHLSLDLVERASERPAFVAPRARDSTPIIVRPAVTPEEAEWAFTIRHVVFVKEQGVPEAIERDAHDAHAFHVLALVEDRPVGTGRLVELPHTSGKIGRMAVLLEARRMGVGARIMDALTSRAEALGLTELYLDAQVTAIGFYERLGYVAEGDFFIEAGIPHRRMRRSLPA